VCGQTALTPGTDAKQTSPFASKQTECGHIVDAMTPLTPAVTQKIPRPLFLHVECLTLARPLGVAPYRIQH